MHDVTEAGAGQERTQLGDMVVIGQYSPKMRQALEVIAERLHAAYDELPDIKKIGNSKGSCLFTALTVRDFLHRIGFADAAARAGRLDVLATQAGELQKWITAGDPDEDWRQGSYHIVVEVPSEGIVIDPTLYQANRPQWHDWLPGMLALPLDRSDRVLSVSKPISRKVAVSQLASLSSEADDLRFEAVWSDRPDVNWRLLIDAKDKPSKVRRGRVAIALQQAFDQTPTVH